MTRCVVCGEPCDGAAMDLGGDVLTCQKWACYANAPTPQAWAEARGTEGVEKAGNPFGAAERQRPTGTRPAARPRAKPRRGNPFFALKG